MRAPRRLVVWDCNCTICNMKRNHHTVVPEADFELLTDPGMLSTYGSAQPAVATGRRLRTYPELVSITSISFSCSPSAFMVLCGRAAGTLLGRTRQSTSFARRAASAPSTGRGPTQMGSASPCTAWTRGPWRPWSTARLTGRNGRISSAKAVFHSLANDDSASLGQASGTGVPDFATWPACWALANNQASRWEMSSQKACICASTLPGQSCSGAGQSEEKCHTDGANPTTWTQATLPTMRIYCCLQTRGDPGASVYR